MVLDFIAGCLGGCAAVFVGHPFDTIKIRMQTQNHQKPIYRNSFHCFQTIIVKESFYGLYRGMSSPMMGGSIVSAIVFGVYGKVQKCSSNPCSMSSQFLAGSIAGLAQTIVCSPMELVKTRMQIQRTHPNIIQFVNPIRCSQKIWNIAGYRGIFKGFTITAARDVPGYACYFVTYSTTVQMLSLNPNMVHTLLAGGTAGIVSWLVTMPLDVIKSRLQADGMITGLTKYTGIFDCFKQSYSTEGILFMTRGLCFTLLRAFPMNAACFFVVSWISKTFGSDGSSGLENLYICKKG